MSNPHPTNQRIMHQIRKGHCEHRKVYTTYLSLIQNKLCTRFYVARVTIAYYFYFQFYLPLSYPTPPTPTRGGEKGKEELLF